MKKIIALALVAAMSLTVLTACGGNKKPAANPAKTPEEIIELYTKAITENGGEDVEYNPLFTEAKEEDGSDFVLEVMGLKEEDMQAFAISMSMRNVQAYTIAAVMPAEGKGEDIKSALEAYLEQKQMEFEFYLPDQYEITKAAKVQTLADGTVLLVMCENSDSVADGIAKAIAG